jgi:DNA-binding CsgD family transcriptional regulator
MLESITTLTRPANDIYAGPERRSGDAAMAGWLARMLDEMDHGMLLITPAGELRHANQPARQELAHGTSLRLANGRVQASHADQHGVLHEVVVDAGRGRRRLTSIGDKMNALSVAAVPMGSDQEGDETLVLLVLGRRQSCEALTVDFFARTQGLTSAEAKVLQALCDGLRPKEAARRLGVAVSTIRTQISSIRTKTQTTSIRDLVSRVTALPPIAPAMKSSALSH